MLPPVCVVVSMFQLQSDDCSAVRAGWRGGRLLGAMVELEPGGSGTHFPSYSILVMTGPSTAGSHTHRR